MENVEVLLCVCACLKYKFILSVNYILCIIFITCYSYFAENLRIRITTTSINRCFEPRNKLNTMPVIYI